MRRLVLDRPRSGAAIDFKKIDANIRRFMELLKGNLEVSNLMPNIQMEVGSTSSAESMISNAFREGSSYFVEQLECFGARPGNSMRANRACTLLGATASGIGTSASYIPADLPALYLSRRGSASTDATLYLQFGPLASFVPKGFDSLVTGGAYRVGFDFQTLDWNIASGDEIYFNSDAGDLPKIQVALLFKATNEV